MDGLFSKNVFVDKIISKNISENSLCQFISLMNNILMECHKCQSSVMAFPGPSDWLNYSQLLQFGIPHLFINEWINLSSNSKFICLIPPRGIYTNTFCDNS